MKRGISASWLEHDTLVIRKARGKFTLEEIEDTLRYGKDDRGGDLFGSYALLLRCTEETCGGNGLYDMPPEGFTGDAVTLHQLNDYDNCPVCRESLPPYDCCPSCGERWKEET